MALRPNRSAARLAMAHALVTTIALSLVTHAATAVAQDTLRERVDAQVQPYIDAGVLQGAVVGIYQQGNTLIAGYASAAAAPPDGDTVYEIGSASKVFTGILLADAVVRGEVRLDEPVNDLLPDGVVLRQKGDVPVTLVQLSTHTSGLPRMPFNFAPADADNPYADYDAAKLYEFLEGYRASSRPGARMEYSNLGVALLGHALTLEAGKPYETLLQERITGPLGMQRTFVAITPELQEHIAPGHLADGTPADNWDFQVFAPAGAIKSTGNDMVRFIQAQLGPPESGLGEAIATAWEIHQQPIGANDFAMGLGWHVARDGSTRWHNGQTGGYHSQMLVSRMLDAGVVVLSNSASAEVDVLAEALIRMLAGAPAPPRTFAQEETVDVPMEVMERYAGQYQLMPGMVFTVSVENGNLMVGLTGQPAYRVFPRSETVWFYKVVEAEITFMLDDDGHCTGLELFQNGVRQPAKRMD